MLLKILKPFKWLRDTKHLSLSSLYSFTLVPSRMVTCRANYLVFNVSCASRYPRAVYINSSLA